MPTSLLNLLLQYPIALLIGLVAVSPVVAMMVLRKRLQPGKLPHQAEAVNHLKNEASRSLRRLSRAQGSSTVREETHRKLLQFQSKLRFTESAARLQLENELIRMLEEAARYGITVTPNESLVRAA
jgi:hypothetical protein